MPRKASKNGNSAATIGFEAKLWLAAGKVRNNLDADAMTRNLSPLVDRIIANRTRSPILGTRRDTLLPKLMNGLLAIILLEVA